MSDFDKALDILRQKDNFEILFHAFPDGDAIGSGLSLCLILRQMGKKANIKCLDELPANYNFLIAGYQPQDFEPEVFVTTDVADKKLLGNGYGQYEDKIELSIDHHATNKKFAKTTLCDTTASSACEMIYRIAKGLNVDIDLKTAECIYTGLSTDTGCFMYSNTTPETHRIAADLMEKGVDIDYINRIMFDTKSRSRITMERLVLDSMEFYCDDRIAVIFITNEMVKISGATYGETEGITSLPRQVQGVLIGVTFREVSDGNYKVSVRTHAPVDASAICAKFGGGGHVRASGCNMSGDIDEIKTNFIEVCKGFLE